MGNEGHDRRAMLLLTGAGLLAGCTKQAVGEKNGQAMLGKGILSQNDPYGFDPNKETEPPGFDPKFMTLVRISPMEQQGKNDPWGLNVNYASVPVDGLNEAVRLSIAKRIAATVKGKDHFKDKKIEIDYIAKLFDYSPKNKGNWDRSGFEYIGAHSQNETLIWLDIPGAELQHKYFISFSKYASNGLNVIEITPPNSDPPKTEKVNIIENDSFYAKDIDKSAEFNSRPVIRVRNFYQKKTARGFAPRTDADGNVAYAMNIHFTIPDGNGGKIPMVIDPNSGNGPGYEP